MCVNNLSDAMNRDVRRESLDEIKFCPTAVFIAVNSDNQKHRTSSERRSDSLVPTALNFKFVRNLFPFLSSFSKNGTFPPKTTLLRKSTASWALFFQVFEHLMYIPFVRVKSLNLKKSSQHATLATSYKSTSCEKKDFPPIYILRGVNSSLVTK